MWLNFHATDYDITTKKGIILIFKAKPNKNIKLNRIKIEEIEQYYMILWIKECPYWYNTTFITSI